MKFDKFKGISEEREIKEEKKSNLPALLEVRDRFIKENPVFSMMSSSSDAEGDFSMHKKAYAELKGGPMRKLAFTKQDLEDLIFTSANGDYGSKSQESLGFFTGLLLQLWTERSKGNGARFCIKGRGARFDYLFHAANNIDELIVSGFAGEHICSEIGNRRGAANLVVLSNIQGDYAGDRIGCYNGKVNRVIGTDIKGYRPLFGLGFSEGRIKQVIAARVQGENILQDCADEIGMIKQIICAGLEGDHALYEAGGDDGRIDQIVCVNVKGKSTFGWLGNTSEVIQLLYDDVSAVGDYVGAQNIACGGKVLEQSAGSFSLKKIKRILAFAKQVENKSYEEILETADKLYALRPNQNEI